MGVHTKKKKKKKAEEDGFDESEPWLFKACHTKEWKEILHHIISSQPPNIKMNLPYERKLVANLDIGPFSKPIPLLEGLKKAN